jgi:hypothetical protein
MERAPSRFGTIKESRDSDADITVGEFRVKPIAREANGGALAALADED